MTTLTPEEDAAKSVRLLLVDVHEISRGSSRILLDTMTGYEVVGETSEHGAALSMVASLKPDVVIVSMRVKGSNGPDTMRDVLSLNPGVRVVVWTLFDEPEYVKAALDAGALAYVLKQDPAQEMEIAIEQVLQGNRYLSPSVRHFQKD